MARAKKKAKKKTTKKTTKKSGRSQSISRKASKRVSKKKAVKKVKKKSVTKASRGGRKKPSPTKATKKKSRIIWAFDPYANLTEAWERAVEVIKVLTKENGLPVEPVYVLGSENLNWVGEVTEPNVDRFVPNAQAAMENHLDNIGLTNLMKPKVLVNRKPSKRGDVKMFLDYAESTGADLIVLNTHARSGVSRFFLGSFAETVLFKSSTPFMFVSPQTEPVGGLKRALFPTDFSKASKKAFERFIRSAKGFTEEVLLINKVIHPVDAFAESNLAVSGGGRASVESYLDAEIKRREDLASEWIELAEASGYTCRVVIEESPGSVDETILRLAKEEGVDFVAMGSESGPFSVIILGSIVRNVVRSADLPVWVVHIK